MSLKTAIKAVLVLIGISILLLLGIGAPTYIDCKSLLVLGHILSMDGPHDYDPDLKRWKPETLPIVSSRFKYKVREIT